VLLELQKRCLADGDGCYLSLDSASVPQYAVTASSLFGSSLSPWLLERYAEVT